MATRTDTLGKLAFVTHIRHGRAHRKLRRAAALASAATAEAKSSEARAEAEALRGITDLQQARTTFLSGPISGDSHLHLRATANAIRERIETAQINAMKAQEHAEQMEREKLKLARVMQRWTIRNDAVAQRHAKALTSDLEHRERVELEEHVDITYARRRPAGRR